MDEFTERKKKRDERTEMLKEANLILMRALYGREREAGEFLGKLLWVNSQLNNKYTIIPELSPEPYEVKKADHRCIYVNHETLKDKSKEYILAAVSDLL
jgi:hypothetical protein